MGSSESFFTWEQIRENGYVVANGKVYNIDLFATDDPRHPVHMLMKKRGTDCSNDYNNHYRTARSKWRKYKIGRLSSASS